MPSQQELDITYLRMARVWSGLSKAARKQVGCLIVKDCTIISDGYNGTPSGFDNVCEWKRQIGSYPIDTPADKREYSLETKREVLHAESNAISKLAKSTQSSHAATIYITCAPCFDCSKLIIQCGICRVVYGEEYRDREGIILLEKASIKTDHLSETRTQ